MITGLETGEDFVNVSWSPTSEDSDDNPGHKFAIEYKKHGQYTTHLFGTCSLFLVYCRSWGANIAISVSELHIN